MKIITNENECNKIIGNYKNSILDSAGYTKILNSHYNPDSFLFFVEGDNFIPLVVKNNLVTFYGCPRHSEKDSLPNNKALLNGMLSYLEKEGYDFHLLSIHKDYFNLLEDKNKQYDVPYPVEWHYMQIQDYDPRNIFKTSGKNMRKSLKRIANRIQNYTFTTLTFPEFKEQYNYIIKKHISYFSDRGKETIWKNNEDFLLEILTYFNKEENLLIRRVDIGEEIVGISIIVYNDEELILYFGTSLKHEDNYITQIMYLEELKIAKEISNGSKIMQANAMRGAFSYKKKLGFVPVPLYALAKDDNWIVQTDNDIDPKFYEDVYGRSSWGNAE